jgi:hypothetical protein
MEDCNSPLPVPLSMKLNSSGVMDLSLLAETQYLTNVSRVVGEDVRV